MKYSTPLVKTVDYDDEENWFPCHDDDDDDDDDDEMKNLKPLRFEVILSGLLFSISKSTLHGDHDNNNGNTDNDNF